MSSVPRTRRPAADNRLRRFPLRLRADPARSGRTLELRVLNARTDRPEPGSRSAPASPPGPRARPMLMAASGSSGRSGSSPSSSSDSASRASSPSRSTGTTRAPRTPIPVPREHMIRLEPASTIGGTIRDEQDQPIAGAQVRLGIPVSGNRKPGEPRVNLNNFRTQTDAEGRWKCDLVPARLELLSITVEHPDYVVEHNPFWRRTESPQAFADLEAGRAVLVLKEGLTLEGRVIDRDGRPIAWARVSPVFPNRSAAATTDDRGRFEVAHIAPGPIELTVQARGHVPRKGRWLRVRRPAGRDPA